MLSSQAARGRVHATPSGLPGRTARRSRCASAPGADRIAERDWSLLAFEDPDGDAVSAFFDTPMLEGEGSAAAPPLVPMLEAAGARVEGLRLGDGTLVLKVEADGVAVQLRIANPAPLLAGGGVRLCHDWGLALPVAIARLGDLVERHGRGPFDRPGPSARDRRAGSREQKRAGARERKQAELMTVLEADQKGRTWCEIAVLLWGRERVAEEWWPGGWMRARISCRRAKARAMPKGYRDIAARR